MGEQDERAPDVLLAGEYFLAVEGLAMIRTVLTDPPSVRPRLDDIRGIVERFEEFPNSLAIRMTEHEVEAGYTSWAPRYDGPNPAIAREQPIVHAMFAEITPGVALDAACGTGRHAAELAELGHHVIGVDGTEAMLAVAREKVPAADFRLGRLEALPVDDASIDFVTCALALTHVAELEPAMREVARVLRPGGQAVLSDIHPLATIQGGIAGFPGADITEGIPYVRNLIHLHSEYLAAFRAAGLSVVDCVEPLIDDQVVRAQPAFLAIPDATRQAYLDLPFLLIWRLERTR
jgi:ubiquinone/menaquinone biosynthesis C-methylase UbiE